MKPRKLSPKKKLQALKKKIVKKRPLRSLRKMASKVRRVFKARVTFPSLAAGEAKSQEMFIDDRIPSNYGDNKLVLLVRDPWWLFSYWELEPSAKEAVARQADQDGAKSKKMVLRVYDVTRLSLPRHNSFFDIELNFFSDNWYVDVGIPDRDWAAEIGYRTDSGRFYPVIRSNVVRTPSFGLSDVLDEEWMLPEDIYYRIIGRAFGAGIQEGSEDIRKLLEKYLRNIVSSESVPSFKAGHPAGAEPISG